MNLLINPNFEGGASGKGSLSGWHVDIAGCWDTSHKTGNPSPQNTAAQCDQDLRRGILYGWPTGLVATLYQIVEVGEVAHNQISLTLTEVQHHGSNIAQIRIYGRLNGEWFPVWSRLEFGNDVPPNTLASRSEWYTNTYTQPVDSITFDAYMLEFYGRIDAGLLENQPCGWKFTNLVFEVA